MPACRIYVELRQLFYNTSSFFEKLENLASLRETEVDVVLYLTVCRKFDSKAGRNIGPLHRLLVIFISNLFSNTL